MNPGISTNPEIPNGSFGRYRQNSMFVSIMWSRRLATKRVACFPIKDKEGL